MKITEALEKAVEQKASDIHINIGLAPVVRKNTVIMSLDFPEITSEDLTAFLNRFVYEGGRDKLEENKDIDFAVMLESRNRFRVNVHYQRGKPALSFRVIPNSIPELNELELPGVIEEIMGLPRGLVLVTGPAGSGKSTTLAATINKINEQSAKRIITLEDPIEYLFENKLSHIEQRELGRDVTNFASGLKHAMRQDPDIIMLGEMRDLETTSAAITAAETGHLVLSTLHTINAAQTIERIIDIYPDGQQNHIRSLLSNTLKAVVSQTLFQRKDMEGMIPCSEVLVCNSAAKNCIRDNRLHEIPNIIETSRQIGMHSLDKSILDTFYKGAIYKNDAVAKASNQTQMQKVLGKVYDEKDFAPIVF
ncbi:Twitching mobility protein [Sedimentisphaera cyanobacteriorum]|uniref:Twitching mobility protein n=1 Tax=Sedimentisphaera cyanobacteriorum TaxID=1940790 RepID=A0A1Q2HN68_9BACT|nr:PilT/PilU family type 4a pilus ATPase [Sedimentisphaera cyanobacteriorum]AQQ08656.1 Twitching mobility protein [Sedimentisphaera cyanobacteriorum]